ncbi:MAG: hypothetical protein C0397_14885 [Odoribacter sp.]|nr:hypothetical protein [Odoribacter sp.]
MNLSSLISNIHWIPVIVMTVFSFALGAAWHQKFLFGKTWKQENHSTLDQKMNIPLIFGGTAVMHFLALAGLSALVSNQGWHNGLHIGLLVSAVWVLPAMTATYLFANRSMKLLAIDAGMYVVLFAIAGLVMGIW